MLRNNAPIHTQFTLGTRKILISTGRSPGMKVWSSTIKIHRWSNVLGEVIWILKWIVAILEVEVEEKFPCRIWHLMSSRYKPRLPCEFVLIFPCVDLETKMGCTRKRKSHTEKRSAKDTRNPSDTEMIQYSVLLGMLRRHWYPRQMSLGGTLGGTIIRKRSLPNDHHGRQAS